MRSYTPATKPYQYQAEATAKALAQYRGGHRGFALWCEPGTGKTKMAIDVMGTLWAEHRISRVIVVAPKGVHRQWATEQLPEHSGGPYTAYWWHPGRKEPWVSQCPYVDGTDRGLLYYCVNYEALLGAGRPWEALKCGAGSFGLVLDESHYVKNYRAQRTKACRRLAELDHCAVRLLLSGTPIAQKLEDEWSQLNVADPAILAMPYVGVFRNTYCVMGGYEGREFLGPRNLEHYRSRTAPHIYRATKTDALPGLPAKRYSRHTFSMLKPQRRAYHEMRRYLLTQLKTGEIATAANAAVAVLRLQQISNGFLRDEAGVDQPLMPPTRNPRLQALRQLLAGTTGPLVIWCRFRYDVEQVSGAVAQWGYGQASQLVGGQPMGTRAMDLELWLGGLRRVLVATPGAGGTGLNLQDGGCRRAVYYSNDENYVHRHQSEDRIHRIGTAGSCHYIDLVARGSRDAAILRRLRAKRELSALVLDDYIHELEEL